MKYITLTLFLFLFLILINGCAEVKKVTIEDAPQSYSTQEECEQETGCRCGFVTCDDIPEGETFEVCGKNFQKGWQCTYQYIE